MLPINYLHERKTMIIVMVFMITFNNNVYAAELDNMQHNDQAYVLNSFSGNNLESISVQYAWSAAFSFEETQTLLKQTRYPHGIRGLRCSLCFHSFK